ncbi:hypothetical protein I302_101662 [Kwoniella bestiolae CBS 10118]|uniref:Conserved oligomeric Golgi complex subunit 8 n=1 Tax=Kwoniella bestiolae CBS 10118 TaxID=1296100 RepID=A0A1B9GCV0_9TREE|nr:hypothetical protein I302_00339 [Kwoniella bestiolae CBS 10118]OCF28849.1 hypothetical protein I302_00339 [Kwoniella bestiolae CBS 10118]
MEIDGEQDRDDVLATTSQLHSGDQNGVLALSDEQEAPPTLLDLLQSSSPAIDFSNPSATQYVDQLLSLSLHELLRQPQLISTETSTVESDLTNLCFREYPTFISVHKCSSAVSSAFDDFSDSLGKLIGAIPSLEDECKTFTSTTGSIQNVRGKAALVQEHQDKLLDLLELPQLMETCVRNGYYQEAMELLNHCHSLSKKYASVALVQDVNREVEGILQLMLAQLLALLREPVKLPALVKTVSFLRRLDAMDESELGLVFISSRYHNFRAQLLSIDRDKAEPVRYLRKYIDLFREHVYDIIAQFTAIFLEASSSPIAALHITSFARQAITDLVDLVTAYIPRISSDSGSMSSILVQLGYCAMSFSRVGLDFAPLISAPFSSTVLSTFSQSLANASTDFSSILRDSAKAVLPPSQILVVAEHIPHIVSSSTSPPPLPPIDSVSHFPPIATLINAYLTAFNNLRLLAPLELHSQLVSIHTSSLLSSTSVLLQYVTQATSISDEIPLSPVKSRPGHGRTPSAPRADLLRRNSEVLMTPEARAAKRREAKRVCVASADVWCRMVVPFLVDKLNEGVFADIPSPETPKDLQNKLEELERWVKDYSEGVDRTSSSSNGTSNGNTDEPRTPPRKSAQLVSSPVTFNSPFKSSSSSNLPAIPDLATPKPKNVPAPPTPHSQGIDAVFDSPQLSGFIDGTNHTHVPEPASLRESNKDTVENMEAQLEAMNIGLTGEEAAVAVEVKHLAHQHPPLSQKKDEVKEAILNGEDGKREEVVKEVKKDDESLGQIQGEVVVENSVNQKVVKDNDVQEVATKEDEVKIPEPKEEDAGEGQVVEVAKREEPDNGSVKGKGVNQDQQPIQSTTPEEQHSSAKAIVDESAPGPAVDASHAELASSVARPPTPPAEQQDESAITEETGAVQAVLDESFPVPSSNAVDADPLPSTEKLANGDPEQAAVETPAPSLDETEPISTDAIDDIPPLTNSEQVVPDSIVQPADETTPALIKNGSSTDQQQSNTEDTASSELISSESQVPIETSTEATPNQPEETQSTPTSADASRAPSPDGTDGKPAAAAPSTSGGNSKKKKKKKGKK